MSGICRACGQNHLFDQVPFDDFQVHARTYFKLTSIQLHEHENPNLLKLCQGCVDKLTDFERFRDICYQVHCGLRNKMKAESKDDFKTLLEEKNGPSNQDDSSDYDDDDRKSNEIPLATMLFVTSEEGIKDEFLSEEEFEGIASPKKKRALNGSKKKPVQPVQYSCDQCTELFQDRLMLIAHKRGLAPFYCEICKQKFGTLLDMKMHHVEKHTERRKLTCEQPGCGEQFGSYQALRHHKTRTHDPNYTGPKPRVYICEHCGDSFGSKQKLTRHRFATHEPQEKPYICEICCLRFAIPYKLKHHMKRHEGIRSHVCPHCGVAKVTKGELVSHMNNVHKNEPPLSNGCYREAFCGEKESTSSIAPSSSEEAPSKSVPEKRKQEEGWVRNVRKNNRNYGKAYVRKDNVLVEGKTFQQKFECGCPRKCREKFDTDAILVQFFDSFWNLGNWHKQNALLSDQVKGVEVNRHRPRGEHNPRPERTVSFQYFIPSEHENVRVCQKYFLGILQISAGRLYKCLGRK